MGKKPSEVPRARTVVILKIELYWITFSLFNLLPSVRIIHENKSFTCL